MSNLWFMRAGVDRMLLEILKCVSEYENCNILMVYNMYWYRMEKVRLRCEYCSCIVFTYF
jgi:hypothetical protein